MNEYINKTTPKIKDLILKKIITSKELESTIEFLKNGYLWSNRNSQNILRNIIKANKDLNFYGYCLLDSSQKIYCAILLYYQGDLEINYHNKKIVNLSALYVDPIIRGIASIYFFKKVIKELSNYIITDCTPNSEISNFEIKYGFKRTENFNYSFNIFNIISNLKKIPLLFLKKNLDKKKVLPLSSPPEHFFKGNCKTENIIIGNSSITILVNSSKKEKKIFNYTINFNTIKIIWSSNNSLFIDNFYKIMFLMHLKKFSIFSTTHINLNKIINIKYLKKVSFHHYLAPKEINIADLAIGSELCY